MRKIFALGLLAIPLAGCDFNSNVSKLASVVAHSQLACQDVALLGSDVGTVVGQVSAANPNDAKIQAIAMKVSNGVSMSNTDCQTLAAAFKAEAPETQKASLRKIHLRGL